MKIMDHKTARETGAPIRYISRQMKPAERNPFEEHLLGCSICASDVRNLSELQQQIRRTMKGHGIGEDSLHGNPIKKLWAFILTLWKHG